LKKVIFIFLSLLYSSLSGQAVLDSLYLKAYAALNKGDSSVFASIKPHVPTHYAYELCRALIDKKNAEEHYTKAFEYAKPGREKAIVLIKWGNAVVDDNNILKSMNLLSKAELEYNFPSNDPFFFELHHNIAMVFSITGKHKKSNERYEKLYKVVENTSNNFRISRITNNIALNCLNLKEYDKAEEYLNISLAARIKENNTFMLGQTYNNFGTLHYEKGNYELALKYYERGYHLRKADMKYQSAVLESEINIGKTYLKLRDYKKAGSFLNAAITVARDIENLELVHRAGTYLKDFYVVTNNYKKAFEIQEESYAIYDSLFGLEKREQIHQVTINNEFRTKIMTDSLNLINKQQEIKYSEEKHKKDNIIILVVSLLLLIVLSFGMVLLRQNKQKQKINELITRQSVQLKQTHKDIKDSIFYAKNLQDSMLPSLTSIDRVFKDNFVLYMPKDIVSGDFYWIHEQTSTTDPDLDASIEKRVFFALADCTGHGVPGSMVSLVGITSLNRCISEFKLTQPAQILDKMAVLVAETFSNEQRQLNDGMDISLCCIEYATDKSVKLYWAGANNDVYIIRGIQHIELKATRRPVGAYIKNVQFGSHEMELMRGDQLYLFTDGFGDQFGGQQGKKLKNKRLKEHLVLYSKESFDSQGERLKTLFFSWKKDREQVDDVSVIGFRIS
jgi:serine phosphatase RsbU (regulator of sigma subunit)